ncbi:MAG: hypothetical protein WCS43_02465 [Verrucomicrobiota bacterium]
MKSRSPNPSLKRASTLIDAVIAICVLAVAAPLVLATMTQAGKSGLSAEAETRCAWMIPACMEEIHSSRDGRPQYFTPTSAGQIFPPADDIWALAFGPDGKPVGKISKSHYDKGTKEMNGKPVFYLASMAATTADVKTGETPMMNVRISIDYPASAPVSKRQKLDFHTRIP